MNILNFNQKYLWQWRRVFVKVGISVMLQWMGGSRRKVKTSRKSIQNRQHQYFQQRKRQQRTQVLEQNVDDPVNMSQNTKHSKSLDVASLMNICLAVHATSQPDFTSTSEVCSKEKGTLQRNLVLKSEQTKDHVHTTVIGLDIEHHLVQNASIRVDAETQWTPSSATKAEKASGGTEGSFLPNCHDSCQGEKPDELKDQLSKANRPPKKFSLLNIISDISEEDCQKRSPMELYAAFAVEGTGKIKGQTPNSFAPMEGKSSVFTRVDDLESDLSAMPINASSQSVQHLFGWEDETHKKGIFSEKCYTSDFFTPPNVSHKENLYSINERGIQENSHMLSWDGSSQEDVSFMEFLPLPTNSSMMYDNRSRDSIFFNARYAMDEISNTLIREDNSYWSPVTLCKELESNEKGYRFTREDIEVTHMDFPENITLINKPHYDGVYKMKNLRNNVNHISTDLDCSSSTTFDPYFTMKFGTENGDNIWHAFRSDESLSASIGNISWLHDHPVERNCSPFDNMPRRLVEFMSLRTENDCAINIINEDELEIKSCRKIAPDQPNFYKQRLCETQEDIFLEQFDIASSSAMSGDSETSFYLEEVSVMPKKSYASMMEIHSQTKAKATLDSMGTKFKNDKRVPMVSSPFNSRSSSDATFQSNFPTSKPSIKKYKSSVSREMEPVKEENKNISSPLYCLEKEEKIKYLEIPQNTDQNKFIEKQDNRTKLNTIDSTKNVDKISSSVDQDKIVMHGHEDSQRLTTQHSDERSVDSKHNTCNLWIESSLTHVDNQENIQLIETQNHIDKVHQLEVEEVQTNERETQEAHLFHEDEHLTMCPKEQLNAKAKRMENCKTQGHSQENYLHKKSQMTISETNGEKIKSQSNQSLMDNTAAMEYQSMLESYILQLHCMHKALKQTMD